MKERRLARIQPTYEGEAVVPVLLAEHQRTRVLLRRAWHIAREVPPSPAVLVVAREVHDFFAFANPLHEIDEEQSVVPALEAYGPRDDVKGAVSHVVVDHQRLDELRDEAADQWAQIVIDPLALDDLREVVRRATKRVARAIAAHMAWEERAIFPRVERYVPLDIQGRLLSVMAARHTAPRSEPRPTLQALLAV